MIYTPPRLQEKKTYRLGGFGNCSFENRVQVPWVLAEDSRYAAEGVSPGTQFPPAWLASTCASWDPHPPPKPQVAASFSHFRTEKANSPLHIPRPRNPWTLKGPRLNALHLVFKKREVNLFLQTKSNHSLSCPLHPSRSSLAGSFPRSLLIKVLT